MIAADVGIGARTVIEPLSSTIKAMVLRLLRMIRSTVTDMPVLCLCALKNMIQRIISAGDETTCDFRENNFDLQQICDMRLSCSSELRTLPNVLLTPHVRWKVREVFHEFVEIAADQLVAWLSARFSRKEVLNPGAMEVERQRSGALSS